jgi:hypothetical protein
MTPSPIDAWMARSDAHGPKTRIYLLERRDREQTVPAPRPGSFSWSRGDGPVGFERKAAPPALDPSRIYGLEEILAAKRRAEAPRPDEAHVLTLDLEEIPELAEAFPGARAVALFAPLSGDPEDWAAARLLPVSPTASAPTSGYPLTVIPVEVPAAIFDPEAADDEALNELRHRILNRPGHVLGGPIHLQEPFDSAGGPFVMQLAGAVGGLPLGDGGALYVFAFATFLQSL